MCDLKLWHVHTCIRKLLTSCVQCFKRIVGLKCKPEICRPLEWQCGRSLHSLFKLMKA